MTFTSEHLEVEGRTPWSAADAHVGLLGLYKERIQGDPRGPGGPPHSRLLKCCK
jgi:hypothetical protein